jgi:ankyrin repeat protein
VFSPLPEYKLYGGNPATNKPFTPQERENKKTELSNKCGLGNEKVTNCCNPYDPNLEVMKQFLSNDMKQKFKKIKKEGENYFMCPADSNDPNCFVPSGYDLCKLSSPELTITDNKESGKTTITGVMPDCLKEKCTNLNDLSYLDDPEMDRFYQIRDGEIITAIQKKNVEQLKDILKNDDKISKPLKVGYPGNTMLHHAVLNDANEISMLLLGKQAPLDLKNKDGNTPLHLAALKGNSSILHEMIKQGGDTEMKNNLGDRVIHSAVRSADYSTVHVLLDTVGASVVVKNKLGETPLHIALISPQKNIKIVKKLIEQGSNIFEKNNNGHTPLKTLDYQRKSYENEAIRTYIINAIVKSKGKDYVKWAQEYPEIANFNVVDANGKLVDLKHVNGLEALTMSIPDEHDKNLKYKELNEEERRVGNINNPLDNINYFNRGVKNNMTQKNTNNNMTQSRGQSRGQSKGQSKGQSRGQSRGQSSGQSRGQTKGQSRGQSSGQTKGQSRGQSSGQSSGQSRGTTQSSGGTTQSSGGTTQSSGGTTQSSGGTTQSSGGTTQSSGGTTQSSGTTQSTKKQDNVDKQKQIDELKRKLKEGKNELNKQKKNLEKQRKSLKNPAPITMIYNFITNTNVENTITNIENKLTKNEIAVTNINNNINKITNIENTQNITNVNMNVISVIEEKLEMNLIEANINPPGVPITATGDGTGNNVPPGSIVPITATGVGTGNNVPPGTRVPITATGVGTGSNVSSGTKVPVTATGDGTGSNVSSGTKVPITATGDGTGSNVSSGTKVPVTATGDGTGSNVSSGTKVPVTATGIVEGFTNISKNKNRLYLYILIVLMLYLVIRYGL